MGIRYRIDDGAPTRRASPVREGCRGPLGCRLGSSMRLCLLATVMVAPTPVAHAEFGMSAAEIVGAPAAAKGDRLVVSKADRLALAWDLLGSDIFSVPFKRNLDALFGRFSAPDEAETSPDDLLRFEAVGVPRSLVETIVRAALATRVDPVYLMAVADKESSFLPDVRAGTSSAVGLYQFIEKTWLEMVRVVGPKYGLAEEAAAIEMGDDGPVVADSDMRRKILDLRRDPFLSAVMAGELAKRDQAVLEAQIGRPITPAESYLAHFFGIEAAGRFLERLDENPGRSAPSEFPAAARANQAIFFRMVDAIVSKKKGRKRVKIKVKEKKPLSFAEVYGHIDRMIDRRVSRYSGVMDRVGSLTAFAATDD
jgi:hypothetical protein